MAILGINPTTRARSRPHPLATACLAVMALWGGRWSPAAAADAYPESAVEAVFLYRFASFIEWPPEARVAPHFTIAVLGADPVADALARLLPNHAIGGRPAQVHKIRSIGDLGDAQILYIGGAHEGNLHDLIATVAHRPVLVVTDEEAALDNGSMVNFRLTEHRVRFEISTAAAAAAGLKISSQMLAVAVRVKTGRRGPADSCGVRSLSSDAPSECLKVAML